MFSGSGQGTDRGMSVNSYKRFSAQLFGVPAYLILP